MLRPGKWVDLDTLTESTLRGLRDAGAVAPRYGGLDMIVATKRFGSPTGVTARRATAEERSGPAPGSAEIDAHDDVVPRPGNAAAKRAWREVLAAAWAQRPALSGDVWADVSFAIDGSLLGPLEVVLDALEPVLGRDPRGRTWQEFFPNDDRIVWLRVRRRDGPAVQLRLGALD